MRARNETLVLTPVVSISTCVYRAARLCDVITCAQCDDGCARTCARVALHLCCVHAEKPVALSAESCGGRNGGGWLKANAPSYNTYAVWYI